MWTRAAADGHQKCSAEAVEQQRAAGRNLRTHLHVFLKPPSLQPAWLLLQSLLRSPQVSSGLLWTQPGSTDSQVPLGRIQSRHGNGTSRIADSKQPELEPQNQQARSQQLWFVPRRQSSRSSHGEAWDVSGPSLAQGWRLS